MELLKEIWFLLFCIAQFLEGCNTESVAAEEKDPRGLNWLRRSSIGVLPQ